MKTLLAVLAVVLIVGVVVLGWRSDTPRRQVVLDAPPPLAAVEAGQGFLFGRVTTVDGATYEGRLRWGDGAEAFWGDTFNGAKSENVWARLVAPERLPRERKPFSIFGVELARRERPSDLGRPFMARFGDISRVEARGNEVRVTLKNGAVFNLDRFAASDFDDGVRVWDAERGLVDLDSGRIRSIEFRPTPLLEGAPRRLYGTVRARRGEFTGFIQWNRTQCVGTDELRGRTDDGEIGLRFDSIQSIERSGEDSVVRLRDGREIRLVEILGGAGHRGVYVDDPRYGRVLVSWNAFERLELSPAGSGPAFDQFPPGEPIWGTVTDRTGRQLSGRLVYDLDESESTETLDAPLEGVDYMIPFGSVASIETASGSVTLRGGELLQLESGGDLGEANAGVLVFVEGQERPEYLPWVEIERIDLRPLRRPAD
jgi:hypothetical protein